MQRGLEIRVQDAADSFNSYFMNSYTEYYQMAVYYTDSFDDKDRIELQFISPSGRIQASSYGLTVGTSPRTTDITDAVSTGEKAVFQGKDPATGESILSVAYPLMFNERVVGVMRLVTALRTVDRQVMLAVLAVFLIAAACMAMVVISNLLFINRVVEPVAVVSDAAKRISGGGYGIQIENRYTDELAGLVDNINDMSLKIGQNEKMKTEFISSVSHEPVSYTHNRESL